ncbi:hypothetical protein [Actinophytocola sediminis]
MNDEPPVVRARHHAHLVAPRQGEVRVSASVGPAGEVVALWATAVDLATLTSATISEDGARFPDARAAQPVGVRVSAHAPTPVEAAPIRLPVAHPFVQPLPDGRLLVVGARCRWRPDGPDRNAIVYDDTGAVLAEHTLGDGIAHVLATGRGEVWVGYYDEGILGNYGWGFDDGDTPIGECGLIRFSPELAPDWRYPMDRDNPWDTIADCYALNVDGDTAWTSCYTDFPVVRVREDTLSGWHNDVHGASAIAVDGDHVALFGGYDDPHRLATGVLDEDRLHVTGEYRLVLPDGEPLPRELEVIGRGPDFHLLAHDTWLRLSLDDLRPVR